MDKESGAATLEIVRLIGAEFSTVDNTSVEKWCELCAPTVSKKFFKRDYEQAVALLVCHKMKMAGLGDTSSGTIPETMRVGSYAEGGVSISYSAGSASAGNSVDAEFFLTSYGVQFVALRRNHSVPIMIRGMV